MANRQLPLYQCHKFVHALHIDTVQLNENDGSAYITPKDKDFAPFLTCEGWASRFNGSADDPGVYVVYQDGYTSWSPTAAFNAGYTPAKKAD